MTKVKIKASAESFEKAGEDRGDFVVPKNGWYVLQLTELNAGFSKGSDGSEDKKRPRLEAIYQITGVGRDNQAVEENYGNVWDYVSFSDESEWKRAEFLWAHQAVDSKDGDVEMDIDTDKFVEEAMPVLARLKQEKGRNADDEPRAKVAKLLPFTDGDTADAFGSDAGGEDEDAFGGGEEAGEDELLTQEQLEGMDLKELGKIAPEFDLDPNDSIVKVRGKVNGAKTKAKLIEAILEAQGADDGETGTEDESPF